MQKEIILDQGVKYLTPTTPNFIRLDGKNLTIPIHEFNETELREFGKVWTENLVKKKSRRKKK